MLRKDANLATLVAAGRRYLAEGLPPSAVMSRLQTELLRPAGVQVVVDGAVHVLDYGNKTIHDDLPATPSRPASTTPSEASAGTMTAITTLSATTNTGSASASSMANTKAIIADHTARVSLSCPRGGRDHSCRLAAECNGVVVDPRTWEVLAVPPPALAFNARQELMVEGLRANAFDIVHVDYGSVITLYNRGGSGSDGGAGRASDWVMASANTFEIDHKIWMGTRTFRELLEEVLAATRTADEAALDLAELNPAWCYTIGFHHPEYHPFNGVGQAPLRAWFIRAVHVAALNDHLETLAAAPAPSAATPAAPTLTPAMVADNAAVHHRLPAQAVDPELTRRAQFQPNEILEQIQVACRSALGKYAVWLRGLPPAAIVGTSAANLTYQVKNSHAPAQCYGYILMARAPGYPNCLIESDLMTKIRQLACIRPPRVVRHDQRLAYMTIIATASLEDCRKFRELFPAAAPLGARLDALVSRLASRVIDASKPGFRFGGGPIDQTVQHLIQLMRRHEVDRIPDSIGIAQDFILRAENAEILLKLMTMTGI